MSASQKKLYDIFCNLAYEPVLDSDSSIKAWAQSHSNGTLTSFINGDYLDLPDINGKQFDTLRLTVKNPATAGDLAKLIKADESQIKHAVESSQKAFESWRSLSSVARGEIVYNIARNIQKNLTIMSLVEAVNSGRTVREARDLDVASVIKSFYYYAGACSMEKENYEPLGVVAIFGHYDSPLLSVVSKLACALATGNACIVVPHILTPLSVFMLAEICVQSGVPAGVLNILVTDNNDALKHISSNPAVSCICFDGPTNVAQEHVVKASAVDINKKCVLSLNGKSTLVIYDSADNDSAIESIVDGCFYANGQHRYSLNKVLVQENIFDDILQRLETRFKKLRVGSNLDKCNDYGPFVNQNDLSQLRDSFSDMAFADTLQFNECVKDRGLTNLQAPIIITNLETSTEFYQSEFNGPYVILVPFRTVKESIELINTQRTGSGVSLWSQNISLVMEVAYSVQVGTVWINSFGIEKGVQVRKMSGNYNYTGEENILTFRKPKWDQGFKYNEQNGDFEKQLKVFGATDANAILPITETPVNVKTYKFYIGGKQTRPDSQSSRNFYVQSSNGSQILYCLLPDAGRKDVRNAVEAANVAYNDWKKRTNHNKAQIIYYFGENLTKRRDEFVKILETHTKKTRELCEREFDLCLRQIFYYASVCDKYVGRLNDTADNSVLMELQESIGCIGIVCGVSSNPLLTFLTHFLGAIAYGNSVVIVVDEKSPFPAMDLYEILETSDMPGVVNVLSGNKAHLTKFLCEHQQVSAVWYMSDNTDKADLAAMQFIRHTSNFNLKQNWFINVNLFGKSIDHEYERFLQRDYSFELRRRSVQYKYISVPMGVIFAN